MVMGVRGIWERGAAKGGEREGGGGTGISSLGLGHTHANMQTMKAGCQWRLRKLLRKIIRIAGAGTKLGEKFAPLQHVSENDQRDALIILSCVCWGFLDTTSRGPSRTPALDPSPAPPSPPKEGWRAVSPSGSRLVRGDQGAAGSLGAP